jgi:endonuclease/exonuclease/phosphatase family metal-dependent hydrolase
VFNVHFDHESAPSRARSAELLAARLEARARSEPAIVMGDFNAAEDAAPMRYLRGELERASEAEAAPPSPRLRDTFRVIHPGVTEVGTFHGFRGTTGGGRIDAILVTETWTVSDAAIVRWSAEGRYPSDHHPVVAQLTLPGR